SEAEEKASAAVQVRQEAADRAEAAERAFEESDRIRERAERVAELRAVAEREASRLRDQVAELAARIEKLAADLTGLPALEEEHASVAGARERHAAGQKLAEASNELASLERER